MESVGEVKFTTLTCLRRVKLKLQVHHPRRLSSPTCLIITVLNIAVVPTLRITVIP